MQAIFDPKFGALRFIAVLIVVAIVISACSPESTNIVPGDELEINPTVTPSPVPTTVSDIPDATLDRSQLPDIDSTPDGAGSEQVSARRPAGLEAIFGTGSGQEVLIQDHIRDCMVAQGFEYVPTDSSSGATQIIAPDSREFIEEFGYGISTTLGGKFPSFSEPPPDPNAAYVESLDPIARAAYDKALLGDAQQQVTTSVGQGSDTSVVMRQLGGCSGDAREEIVGTAPILERGLLDEIREIDGQVTADARVIESFGDWSSCMAQSGFDFADRASAEQYVRDRSLQVTGQTGGSVTILPGAFVITSQGSATGSDADPGELAALQEEEIRTAVTDFGCYEQHVKEIAETVRLELEEAFINSHPELLGAG